MVRLHSKRRSVVAAMHDRVCHTSSECTMCAQPARRLRSMTAHAACDHAALSLSTVSQCQMLWEVFGWWVDSLP